MIVLGNDAQISHVKCWRWQVIAVQNDEKGAQTYFNHEVECRLSWLYNTQYWSECLTGSINFWKHALQYRCGHTQNLPSSFNPQCIIIGRHNLDLQDIDVLHDNNEVLQHANLVTMGAQQTLPV